MKDFYYLFIPNGEIILKQGYLYSAYRCYTKLNVHTDKVATLTVI